MAVGAALKFRENQAEIMTPILPADQSMANTAFTQNGQTQSLSGSFGTASAQATVAPQAPSLSVAAPSGIQTPAVSVQPNNDDIAASANNVGASLQGMQGGIRVGAPKGDIGYAGGEAMKMGGELFAGIGKLLNANDGRDGMDDTRKAPVPQQLAFNGGMPSPG